MFRPFDQISICFDFLDQILVCFNFLDQILVCVNFLDQILVCVNFLDQILVCFNFLDPAKKVLDPVQIGFNFLDQSSTPKKNQIFSKTRTSRFFVSVGSLETIRRKLCSRKPIKGKTLKDSQLFFASEKCG